ncbi:MAG: transglycosylase SLT domain-containing protein [Deltaproteobacteria bacterium]|nr:transglycosylase SLT domain-containing protein [Deltaproteobacteria bacterium]
MILLTFCTVLLAGVSAVNETSELPGPWGFPSLISCLRFDPPLDFCGEEVPLDNPDVRERLEKQLLLSLWNRPQVILWLKRSGRFLPHIEKILKQNNMPEDLKYVAIIESALRPHATSNKRAVGFWQFLESTGRKYRLVINRFMDERRNVFSSTRAAVRYFKELYSTFGSWTLCAAAYNMGEAGLHAKILAQKESNYYHLYLSLETQQFVPKIIAAKMILSNPKKYGFRLRADDYYPPLVFDRVDLECAGTTPIMMVAQAANTHFKMIKDLNPEIRGSFITQGSHSLLIPRGASKGFRARFKERMARWTPETRKRTYVVKRGDSLSIIAHRFKVPMKSIIRWNRLKGRKGIHPGDRLVIYQKQ